MTPPFAPAVVYAPLLPLILDARYARLPQTMSAQPALVSRATFTKEKIALLCLMNMVFERHSQDRNIPFGEIATRTKLPVDQVWTRRLFSVVFSSGPNIILPLLLRVHASEASTLTVRTDMFCAGAPVEEAVVVASRSQLR